MAASRHAAARRRRGPAPARAQRAPRGWPGTAESWFCRCRFGPRGHICARRESWRVSRRSRCAHFRAAHAAGGARARGRALGVCERPRNWRPGRAAERGEPNAPAADCQLDGAILDELHAVEHQAERVDLDVATRGAAREHAGDRAVHQVLVVVVRRAVKRQARQVRRRALQRRLGRAGRLALLASVLASRHRSLSLLLGERLLLCCLALHRWRTEKRKESSCGAAT